MNEEYFKNYIKELTGHLSGSDKKALINAATVIKSASNVGGKIILVGNGGSAAIASHVAVDLTKACKIRSINFNEADLITCYANDYGFENWIAQALDSYSDANDVVILISSSGRSENIINAAHFCREKKLKLITLSGFGPNNELRKLGSINFYVNSNSYNFVEMTHHIWLVSIVDCLAKEKL